MLHARLREIRKKKGMTLAEVAGRIAPEPTTAQTIGRLETGMRTLTVDWVEKIAAAMDADPAELLALPSGGDIAVDGAVGRGGRVFAKAAGVVAMRLLAREPLALRLAEPLGQYRTGDVVVCERLARGDWGRAVGADCLIEDAGGRRLFAKLAALRGGRALLAPLASEGSVEDDVQVRMAAPAVALVRMLGR